MRRGTYLSKADAKRSLRDVRHVGYVRYVITLPTILHSDTVGIHMHNYDHASVGAEIVEAVGTSTCEEELPCQNAFGITVNEVCKACKVCKVCKVCKAR